MSRLHIGTAGWSYDDWVGLVYPADRATDQLRQLARYFDCVEINSSFYQPPRATVTAAWLRATPSSFRFLAKAWQRFTHQRDRPWTAGDRDRLLSGLAPLRDAGRFDALLFQFPWSFRCDARNRAWLDRLAEAFDGWPCAVEVRHDSWRGQEAFFRDRQLTWCNVDQPALARCLPAGAIATTATGYLRLHGRNAAAWFAEQEAYPGARYDYLYGPDELAGLERLARDLAEKTTRTFVIFNNHKDAKAFSNALQLQARLQPERPRQAPAPLLKRYPALRDIVEADGPEQLTLV
jgi:uncharacterized protein YecE (DUF72 family)